LGKFPVLWLPGLGRSQARYRGKVNSKGMFK